MAGCSVCCGRTVGAARLQTSARTSVPCHWPSSPESSKRLSKEVEHWPPATLREWHLGKLGLHDVMETDGVAVGATLSEGHYMTV